MDKRFTSLLIWEVPKGIKKRFKKACKDNDASMKEVIIALMNEYSKP